MGKRISVVTAIGTDVITEASQLPITDTGEHYDSSTVEGALEEAGAQLSAIASNFSSVVANESAPLGSELLDADGWTADGWTGDFATGFTHKTGNTSQLSRALPSTGTKYYLVSFDTSSALVADELYVTIGGSATFDLYAGSPTHYNIGIRSIADGDLAFIPIIEFNKTISNLSVKEVTGYFDPVFIISDSADATSLEFRPTTLSSNNAYIGNDAGKRAVTGYDNLGLGHSALQENVAGFWNVAAGSNALKANVGGSRNVGVGYNALLANVSGQRNQAVGSFALQSNVSGIKNTAIGSDSLFKNTSGSFNIAMGFSALYNNTTGNKNIAIGQGALVANITSNANVAIGASSLSKTTEANSVAVGTAALQNATGASNIALGFNAGNGVTSGANLILIGQSVEPTSATATNEINIGNTFYGSVSLRSAGIGSANWGEKNSLGGTKLEITGSTSRGVVIASHDTNTNGDLAGTFAFDNRANANAAGASRCSIAHISALVYTSDSNASGNSGGILTFNVKNQNAAIAEKMRLDNTGKLGIGVTAPTAKLHLPASTTAAASAPIKMELGVLMTTPEAGAIEYDGTNLYFTDSTGTRHTLAVTA